MDLDLQPEDQASFAEQPFFEMKITYPKNGDQYAVVLKSTSAEAFAPALGRKDIQSLQGEELASALQHSARGFYLEVTRLKNDLRHDGADGAPAYQEFFADGIVRRIGRYKDGKHNDCLNGEPSYQHFSHKGVCFYVTHQKEGAFHDGIHGEPAQLALNRQDGSLYYALHFKDGQPVESLNRYGKNHPKSKPASPRQSRAARRI